MQPADAVSLVNIGPGADSIVLLTVFNIIWSVFQLPGIIKDSLDGWQWLVNLMKTKIRKKEYEAETGSLVVRKTDSEGQGEWYTDIVREARKTVRRGEEGKRPCHEG